MAEAGQDVTWGKQWGLEMSHRHPGTIKLQGKPPRSSQKEIGNATVTQMTGNDETSQATWLFFYFSFLSVVHGSK